MNEFVKSTQIYVLSRGIGVVKIGIKMFTSNYLYVGPLSTMPTEFDCDHTLIQSFILFSNRSVAMSSYDQYQKQHIWNNIDINTVHNLSTTDFCRIYSKDF